MSTMHRAAASETVSTDREFQRLWFSLQGLGWSSLAVIDTSDGSDAERVARRLATVGTRDAQAAVQLLSAVGASFTAAGEIASQIALAAGDGALVLVSCAPVGQNPAMMPILQAAGAAILVVRLGRSTSHAVTTTIAAIGRHKVMASISVGG